MAKEKSKQEPQQPESDPANDDQPVEEPQPAKGEGGSIKPAMSHEELVSAGVGVDLPYESPPGSPEPLTYADDLGDDKGWTPPDGFTIAGVPYEEVVAGVGGGVTPTPGPPAEGPDASSSQDPDAR